MKMRRQMILAACIIVTMFSIPAFGQDAKTYERWSELFRRDQDQTILQETTAALQNNPRDATALRFRIVASGRLDQQDLSTQDLQTLGHVLPQALTSGDHEIRCYYFRRNTKFDEAIADCKKSIQLNPQNILAYFGEAKAYQGKGEIDRALAGYTKSIELDPKFGVAFYERGRIYSLNKNDADKAIVDYDKAIELRPNDSDYYNDRGIAYQNKKLFDRALAEYTKAAELNPRAIAPLLNLGDLQCTKGGQDTAISSYNKAITINPKFARAFQKRGYCYFLKEQYEAAISDFDKAIQLDPKDAAAYVDRAAARRDLHLKSLNSTIVCSAFNDASKAIELAPTWNHPYRVRAYLFEDFLLLPGVGNVFSCLPRAYSLLELARAGIKDADKAIELYPQNDLAFYKRGRLHFHLEEYEYALRDLNKALELDAENATAYCVRAQLHGVMGNAAKKAEDLQKYASFKLGDCTTFVPATRKQPESKQAESSRQLPSSNRKGPCGCYACGLLLAVNFPNKSPDCVGIVSTDSCPQALAQLPDKGAAYCKLARTKSKGGSLAGCSALEKYCESLPK